MSMYDTTTWEKKSEIVPCYEVDTTKVQGLFDLPDSGRVPPPIREVGVNRVIGRTVLEACCHLGSYGMGGPGFLGLHLEKNSEHSDEWLVLCLWASDEWILFDGKPIFSLDKTWEVYGQARFVEVLKCREGETGKVVKSFDIADKSCKIMLDDVALEFTEDPKYRPAYSGSGGQRVLMEKDSLLDAWVIASTPFLGI